MKLNYYHCLFQNTFPFPEVLAAFFDGKQEEDPADGVKKETISVAVKGPGMDKEKYLGSKPCDGTGPGTGKAVHSLLAFWCVLMRIIVFVFDTCSVNSGRLTGAQNDSFITQNDFGLSTNMISIDKIRIDMIRIGMIRIDMIQSRAITSTIV